MERVAGALFVRHVAVHDGGTDVAEDVVRDVGLEDRREGLPRVVEGVCGGGGWREALWRVPF